MPQVGCLLMLLGLGLPSALVNLFVLAEVQPPAIIGLLVDFLRLLFFAGIAVGIIGILRNRKNQKSTSAEQAPPEP